MFRNGSESVRLTVYVSKVASAFAAKARRFTTTTTPNMLNSKGQLDMHAYAERGRFAQSKGRWIIHCSKQAFNDVDCRPGAEAQAEA